MNTVKIEMPLHKLEGNYVVNFNVKGEDIISMTRYSNDWTELKIHGCALESLEQLCMQLANVISEQKKKELKERIDTI